MNASVWNLSDFTTNLSQMEKYPFEEILIPQLDVPVGEIDEVAPAVVGLGVAGQMDKGSPLRFHRLADEFHAGFVRQAVALARVARDARTNDVFPCRLSAAIAGQHVIKIQILPVENLSAVLAGVFVPLEDVVTGEFDFLLRKSVKKHQHDDARNADFQINGVDHFVLRLAQGKIAPTLEIMRLELIFRIRAHHLGVTLIEKHESAADSARIDSLPKTVQDENRFIEKRFHTSVQPPCVCRLQTSGRTLAGERLAVNL